MTAAATTPVNFEPVDLVKKGLLAPLKMMDPAGIKVNKLDEDGRSMLHWAVTGGHVEIVEYLVEGLKANVNKADEDGWTSLHIASSIGNYQLADYLLQHGAQVDAENSQGNSALFYAVGKQHADICQLLVDRYGANLQHKNRHGQTVVHRASSIGNLQFLQQYLSHLKPLVDWRDQIDGNTALHLACEQHNLMVADFLVKQMQARSDIKNRDGQLAIDVCQDKRSREHLQRLFVC